MDIVSISGSPSSPSRSTALLQLAVQRLKARGARPLAAVDVRGLPASALLQADARHPEIAAAVLAVEQARLVVVATPIYKAAYSGLLKAFLDLLPQDALRGKTVLPLATGGSPAHLLALDYALKPVLAALGARHLLDGVYASDAQFAKGADGSYVADDAVVARLDRALDGLDLPAPHLPRAAAPEALRCPA